MEDFESARVVAFLSIHMYMWMNYQPNYKTCWENEGPIFYYPIISIIMIIGWFIDFQKCLHITNLAT
jgi:hypothetical protein